MADSGAAKRTTVGDLTLGGLIRHLATGERRWLQILRSADGSLPEGHAGRRSVLDGASSTAQLN
ncbi:hypothetical protein [Amycolatopsis sp. NBC_01286]|uniref:hypothetical protein n=1 Tax=Amycolatopsis sp. NBC_01286 TaxID=2903560 RepID=UPI002E110F39|nr:DUF664 domain-containing protein [Amycolatopsis sp. NBC_01286]